MKSNRWARQLHERPSADPSSLCKGDIAEVDPNGNVTRIRWHMRPPRRVTRSHKDEQHACIK